MTAIGFLTVVVGAMAYVQAPQPFSIAFLGLVLACAAAFVRPAVGVYLVIFLTLLGDNATTSWWPFTKNMSSRESIFYVSDVISITPLEVLLSVTMVSFLLRALADPSWRFRRGTLLTPIGLLTLFVLIGFGRGLASGGNRTIAIFEVRALLYIPVLYVLITNLFVTRRQYRLVFAISVVAISIQSIFALVHYSGLPEAERTVLESLIDHPATLAMNAVFVLLIGLMAFGASRKWVWIVAALTPSILYSYLLSQRRAAMIALFVGLVCLFAVLSFRRRRLFWAITPVLFLLGVGFLAVTWNAEGAIGLPSSAVKTVMFPDQLGAQDQASNEYRDLESYNLGATIRGNPVSGVGFGQPFSIVVPMPDISFFEYWQYMPHNSVLWMWLKTGFLGFFTMLFLFGRAVQYGARAALRVTSPDDAALVVAGLGYVIMFLVFAYVDLGWDHRTTVFLVLAMTLSADFEPTQEAVSPEQRADRPTAVPVTT